MAEEARKREDMEARKVAEDERRRAGDNRKADAEAKQRDGAVPAEDLEAPVTAIETEARAPGESKADESKAGATPTPAPRKFTPIERPESKRPEKPKREDRRAGKAEDHRRSGKQIGSAHV